MCKPRRRFQPSDEIEALVRAAGDYVQASEDLRPRVLESARKQRCERTAQGLIARVALGVLLATMLTASNSPGSVDARNPLASAALNRASFPLPTAGGADADNDFGWNMVEAFTEMRRQQSEVLRRSM
jgi:hypothetical protein